MLTRAPFSRALAEAQLKQDMGSRAGGRMGPVWTKATGAESVFSSLSSVATPGRASPSPRLQQPCVRARAKGTTLLPLAPCCAVLSTGPGSTWSQPRESSCDNPTTFRPVQTTAQLVWETKQLQLPSERPEQPSHTCTVPLGQAQLLGSPWGCSSLLDQTVSQQLALPGGERAAQHSTRNRLKLPRRGTLTKLGRSFEAGLS